MAIALVKRVNGIGRELRLFAAASLVMGIAYSIIDATLNNFLNDRFALTGFQRSFLELPRELPGFLVVFVSALLWFLCSRRLGVLSMVLGVIGTLMIAYLSTTYALVVVCLFVYSLGQHIFMPAQSSIGMELAQEGKTGQRLGQLNSIRNFAAIIGSFLVFLGFKYFGFSYHNTFIMASVGFSIAAVLMFAMKPEATQSPKMYLKLRKEYRMYYILAILYGSRKQLFVTFGAWVIVTIFNQPTQTIATLLTIGGIIGIFFQPLLGWAIDRLGEKAVLAAEGLWFFKICFSPQCSLHHYLYLLSTGPDPDVGEYGPRHVHKENCSPTGRYPNGVERRRDPRPRFFNQHCPDRRDHLERIWFPVCIFAGRFYRRT